MIVYPENQAQNVKMAEWCATRLHENLESFGFDRFGNPLWQCMGFSVDGELACVVVAYHYTRPNILWAFASDNPRWATKGNIAAALQWVFVQLKCDRVTSMVLKSNKRSRKFQEGIGFKVEGKMRRATRKGDLMVYGLLKEDYEQGLRKAFNGKRKHTSTGT